MTPADLEELGIALGGRVLVVAHVDVPVLPVAQAHRRVEDHHQAVEERDPARRADVHELVDAERGPHVEGRNQHEEQPHGDETRHREAQEAVDREQVAEAHPLVAGGVGLVAVEGTRERHPGTTGGDDLEGVCAWLHASCAEMSRYPTYRPPGQSNTSRRSPSDPRRLQGRRSRDTLAGRVPGKRRGGMATVAIVGAGPAGASAGYHLASRGHRVTLLDRSAFPRPKVCGDWIAEGSVEALAASGLSPDELERAAPEHAVLSGSRVASPRGETSEVRHSRRAYCIPRLVFDDLLLKRALRAGCTFEKEDVRELRPGHRGRLDGFDHVIDARGVYAGRANCVALRAYWTVDGEGLDPSWATDGAPLRRRRVPARLRLGLPGGARGRAGPLQPRRGPVEGGQPRPGTERRRLLGEVPGREPDGARPRAARRGQGAPAGPPRGGGGVARTGCRGTESSGSETPPTSPTP